MSPAVREADVIVVGAGLSGLIAARTLIAAGLQPLVLEADDRVGGRILTEEVAPGLPVEIGAQWIGDTHRRMFALAAELGVETFAQYDRGETSYELVGSGVLRENTFHERYADELAQLEAVLRRLDELAADQQLDGGGQHGLGSGCVHGVCLLEKSACRGAARCLELRHVSCAKLLVQ